MVPPPRVSSLDDQAVAASVYRFGHAQDGNSTANYPPQTLFDRDSKSPSYDEHNEKTGFTTPNSDTDRPLAYSYQHAPGRNPHISQHLLQQYGKNEWSSNSTVGTGEYDDDICPAGCREVIASRAFKRWAILYILVVIAFWIWFFRYYRPEQKKAIASTFLTDSLKGRFLEESEFGYFGTNKRVEFSGMQHMEVLDRALVPGSETPGVANRRLIVIGDIHGCAEELKQLLDQITYNPTTDHIITTGDMISKGPSSSEVLNILITNNASCVRGNNEDLILHAYRDHHAPSHQKILAANTVTLKHGQTTDLALAATLTPQQITYLTSCPLIINLGPISSMGANTSIVHAGLIPGIPLENQDPSTIMTIRSIDLRNQVPSSNHAPDPSTGPPPPRPHNTRLRKADYTNWDDKGRLAVLPWGSVWDSFQDLIPTLLEEGRRREKNPPFLPQQQEQTSRKYKAPPKRGTNKINPYKDLVQTSVIHGHDSTSFSSTSQEQQQSDGSSSEGVGQGKWHFGLDGGCFRGEGGVLAAMVLEESGFLAGVGLRKVRRRVVTVPCGKK